MKNLIKDTINGIKNSYGDKYSENHYIEFEVFAKKAKNKKDLVILVENFFDLDKSDAKAMVY